VVVVADNKDLFWIAEVTDADDEKIALCYYHYTINRNDEKIYKLHNSTKSCGLADIISHFSIEDRIFTKNVRICKASLKKLQKEYYMYTKKKIQRFKRRFRHKVYEPSNPAKFGLKYYALVDSYLYIYCFKQHQKGTTVVLFDLCTNFLSSVNQDVSEERRLFSTDNYYSSLLLLQWYTKHNLNAVMTMQKNRPKWFWDFILAMAKPQFGLVSIVQACCDDGNFVIG
jgi:hypothetical protein